MKIDKDILWNKTTPEERRAKVALQFHEAQQRQFARVKRNFTRANRLCWIGAVASVFLYIGGLWAHDSLMALAAIPLVVLSVAGLLATDAWLHTHEDRIS